MDWKDLEISMKDLLVLIPVSGTILAIAWETGSFLPVGRAAFGLFSLSEHILFAFEALPFVMSILTGGMLATFVALIMKRSVESTRAGKSISRKNILAIQLVAIVVFVGIGCFVIWIGLYVRRSAIVTVFGLFCICLGVGMIAPLKIFVPRMVAITSIVFALSATVAGGSDETRSFLNGAELAEFNIDGVPRNAVLFRAGERGILIYERDQGSFLFNKWESFKGVTWKRPSLFFLHSRVR